MDNLNQNPEQIARDEIDTQLRASGWVVQHKGEWNHNEGQGQAVREYQTDTGPADYVLFVNRQPIGIIEAKREEEAQNITVVEEQTTRYSTSKLKWIHNDAPLPFLYEATGAITRFTDQRDPKPRSREIFSFHRPETLAERLTQSTSLRTRLTTFPTLDETGLRDCQVTAITNLEKSFHDARPRALVQMATGSGKTFTAITSIYRLLKHAQGKRILFLVDTKNLGEQAEQEFMAYQPSDDNRKFTELYSVQRLKTSHVPSDAQVCISTIQRMYSILQGKELSEEDETENPNETPYNRKQPLPVAYNEKVPIEHFDFIVIDECHRSIYNLWRQVLDYFDSFLIGLTATPDARTFGFFKQNVVSEYSHDDAVADGVNVAGEIFTIETQVTKEGGTVLKGNVEKREKLTRRQRWEQQDEDETYSAKKLDKDIVNPSQIRTIIRTFRDKLPEIFPDRTDQDNSYEVPKTLIFAKTDSHADDIIKVVREEFGEGNAFCKKVTYKNEEDPKSVLAQFRNEYHPRIAVTVDMIATGTDVKPLECLLFMRDVKSRGYFEQMKGRGTRTLDHDGMLKTSKVAKTGKLRYIIVDAIGVTKSLKTSSRPPITKPSVTLKDLAMPLIMGQGLDDTDAVSTLAGRFARIDRFLNDEQKASFAEKTGGVPLKQLTKDLFDAIDGETIETRALEITDQPKDSEPCDSAREQAQKELVEKAIAPLTGAAITHLVETCKANLQTIDTTTIDVLLGAGWDTSANNSQAPQDFETFLTENKDELTALTIFYDQPQRRQELTFAQINEVLTTLKTKAPHLAPLDIWQAYAALDDLPERANPISELTALVSLIRRVTRLDDTLTPFSKTVRRNFRDWILQKNAGKKDPFTETQHHWLKLIRDHIATSYHFQRDDLDYAPFDAQGGLGKMYELFGEDMEQIITNLNTKLVS